MSFEVFLPDRSIRLEGWDIRLAQKPQTEDIFVKETSVFLEAVATGDSSLILSDFHDALKTQRIMDAIRRAINSAPQEVSLCA